MGAKRKRKLRLKIVRVREAWRTWRELIRAFPRGVLAAASLVAVVAPLIKR